MGKTVFVALTHPFSAEIPRWPYFDKPEIDNTHTMAKGGVLTQSIKCTMHTGTHCDAPRHVMEYEFDGRRARYSDEMPIDAYTGQAVVLKIDIEPWGLITDKHLDAACEKYGINQADLEGKIICLNTGMHRLFDDSKAYYHYAAGTGVRAGKWFANLGKTVVSAFKNMWRELRKVTWPSREKLINYSAIVVIFMVAMMVIIGLLDTGASALVNLIMTKFSA